MKWWAQSFIVGIPTILCGYRDDHGMVTDLETLDVKDLRKFGEVLICIYSVSIVFNYLIY